MTARRGRAAAVRWVRDATCPVPLWRARVGDLYLVVHADDGRHRAIVIDGPTPWSSLFAASVDAKRAATEMARRLAR